MESISDSKTSSTLIYRLSQLEEAIRPLALTNKDIEKNKERIIKLFEYEIGHSKISEKGVNDTFKKEMAARFAGLCISGPSSEVGWFNAESVIIAKFLAAVKENS